MKEDKKIYIVGHKNPDTDSICSSIAYADYLRKKGKKTKAVRAGELNSETKFVLDYFKVKMPKFLADASGKKIILLDHNEKTQSPDNIEKAKILEVIDHHKIDFQSEKPILFHNEPVGSTSTLIARRYLSDKKVNPVVEFGLFRQKRNKINEALSKFHYGVKMPKKIAGILLSAILSDTVAFRSPTTTDEDIKIAKKLAKIAEIENIEKFGIEIKKKKANIKDLTAEDIINSDLKTYNFSGKKVAIGHIEVCDLKEVGEKEKELIKKMEEISKKENYALFILMATDIIKIGSRLLISGEKKYFEKAVGRKIKGNSIYLKGVMSRKKQIVPPLMKAFSINTRG